MRKRDSASL